MSLHVGRSAISWGLDLKRRRSGSRHHVGDEEVGRGADVPIDRAGPLEREPAPWLQVDTLVLS